MSILDEIGRWCKTIFDREDLRGAPTDSFEAVRKQHTILQAEMMGAQSYMGEFGWWGGALYLTRGKRRCLRDLIEKTELPCLLIDPRPGLRIIDENEACARATLTDPHRIAGDKLFSVFPDNPSVDHAAVSNLFESLCKTTQEGKAHVMNIQRYDMLDGSGQFVERHWRTVNAPVLDDQGHVLFLINCPVPHN